MKFPQTVSISFMQSQNVLPEWHGNSPSAQCHSCVCKWTNLIHLITLCLHDTSPLPNIAYTYRFHCICKTEQPVSDLFTSFYQILSSMKVPPFAVTPVPEASFYQMPVSGPQHLDHWNFDATLLRWQKKITLEAKPTDFTWQLQQIDSLILALWPVKIFADASLRIWWEPYTVSAVILPQVICTSM